MTPYYFSVAFREAVSDGPVHADIETRQIDRPKLRLPQIHTIEIRPCKLALGISVLVIDIRDPFQRGRFVKGAAKPFDPLPDIFAGQGQTTSCAPGLPRLHTVCAHGKSRPGWPRSAARRARPDLRGLAGIDFRGDFYAKELNSHGIATLEIDMGEARGIVSAADRLLVPVTVPDPFADEGSIFLTGVVPQVDIIPDVEQAYASREKAVRFFRKHLKAKK